MEHKESGKGKATSILTNAHERPIMKELWGEWFEALSRDREESARMLEKPSMSGIQRSVVDKYSDQAHFIYELLQNADDAGATQARFILTDSGLYFFHNGTIAFSVSDPAKEDTDKQNGVLGHVNAITSIANSNKMDASIGKFGVGFKAVFQYTRTPHIYDPGLHFKIEKFIVPLQLDCDLEGRNADETCFWLPFNHNEKTREEAYSDILEKLRTLVFPTLFLASLKSVYFEAGDHKGSYARKQTKKSEVGGTVCQLLTLTNETDGTKESQKMWLFSRFSEGSKHSYSTGFFLGTDNKLVPARYPAFCFFPTKENTGLNFIVNAPFLLTDSREGIKAGNQWNRDLVQKLAQLAADSLLILRDIGLQGKTALIDDGIINLIPYRESAFADLNDRSRISFKPFFTEIRKKMHEASLLPAANGEYSAKLNSYWFQDKPVIDLFSNRQLGQLIKNPKARWVFTELARNQTEGEKETVIYQTIYPKRDYLTSCVAGWFDFEAISKKISGDFICQQPLKWLHKFYAYLGENSSRAKIVRRLPIFIDEQGNAVAAFDERDQPVLFLPDETITGYTTVKKELLTNKNTREFFEKFGIKKPSLRDDIYNKILPEYTIGGDLDTEKHFLKFFKYFKEECPQAEVDDFISLIKDKEFVSYSSNSDSTIYRGKANEIYWPEPDLIEYFATKPDTRFLDLKSYQELVSTEDHKLLHDFLIKAGIKRELTIYPIDLNAYEAEKFGVIDKGRWKNTFLDKKIDGCPELLQSLDLDKSVLLWKQLLSLLKTFGEAKFSSSLSGEHIYFYRRRQPYHEHFESSTTRQLRNEAWLFNQNGQLVSARELTIQALAHEYDTTTTEAQYLINYLRIHDERDDSAHLSDEEKYYISLGKELAGASPEDIREIIREIRAKKARTNENTISGGKSGENAGVNDDSFLSDGQNEPPASPRPVLKKLVELCANETADTEISEPDAHEKDEDEFIKPPVNLERKIEKEMQRSASTIAQIERLQELNDLASSSEKYSFGWFKALLELECINSGNGNAGNKEISICFARVEKEPGTDRTLVLRHPDRYIPQAIEDLADISLIFDMGGQTRKVAIEVVSVKSYTLRAKLKNNAEIDGIDLNLVKEARIDVKDPAFLLEELRKQFNSLDFEDTFNLQQNLPQNIEFVFGPPGTGKTTHLARNVLIPFMQKTETLKILVLTPTNKAADVLVSRIMEIMGGDKSYEKWLVRFGATNDESIEQSPVFRDKTFDIRKLPRNVTVTTIARFPYDYFIPDSSTRLHLAALQWDYIVIDEASMVPVANIIFPIYKKTPEKFIIAGDPFQIEPITTVENWQDENIYSMVKLNLPRSFTSPATTPHAFEITRLTTQYRSIPVIGEMFSRFTYGGILQHHRQPVSQRTLQIDHFDLRPLNIIKFPVSKYESIYRAKRLQGKTPYHIYSALFTFEFTKHIASQIQKNQSDGKIFKIGIIAPYRAQANLIDKLIASWRQVPTNVSLQTGTIHGFQGDECDIIITVFNPPPGISSSPKMFLNKQNILNVSISRARDYLFILMPDDQTENISQLQKVKEIETLAKASKEYSETHANLIEDLIFGQSNYLEENAFSTSHQIVNVYSKPEKRYEVRSEDIAIDVQIHDNL